MYNCMGNNCCPCMIKLLPLGNIFSPPLVHACMEGYQAPFLFFCFERAWCAKIRHVTSLWTSVGVSMETPPFTMTLFQSAYGQVVAWCEYSSSKTEGRIASSTIILYS